MIKDVDGRLDDYSISLMIRQVLLHWGYELVKNDINELFFVQIKMNYYQLNRDTLLEKAKNRYHNGSGKEKTARYYEDNQEVLIEKPRNQYRN